MDKSPLDKQLSSLLRIVQIEFWHSLVDSYSRLQLESCRKVNKFGPSLGNLYSPQVQVYSSTNVGETRNANYNNYPIPEVSGMSVPYYLKYTIVQYLLLEVVCLGEIGKVYSGVIQRHQRR